MPPLRRQRAAPAEEPRPQKSRARRRAAACKEPAKEPLPACCLRKVARKESAKKLLRQAVCKGAAARRRTAACKEPAKEPLPACCLRKVARKESAKKLLRQAVCKGAAARRCAAGGGLPMVLYCRTCPRFRRRLLAAVPSRRLVFRLTGAEPLQCVRIAAGIRPRSPQAERLALPLQASKAFTSLQGDIKEQPLPCHPEPREGSLCEYRLYFYRDPSKACAVLPCLQGVKRARRNRRRMGVCPWQLVAKSASFSAADYFAAAPPLRSG